MVLKNAIEIGRGNGGVKQQGKSHVSTRKRTSGCQKSSWSKIGCISSNWGCWKRSTLEKARHPVVVKKVLLAVPNLSVLLWININVSFFFFFRLIKYFNNQENFLDYHLNRIYCYFDQTFHHQVIYFGLENKEIKIFSFSNLFFAFSYFNGEIIFKVQYSIDHKWSRIIVSIIHQLTFST